MSFEDGENLIAADYYSARHVRGHEYTARWAPKHEPYRPAFVSSANNSHKIGDDLVNRSRFEFLGDDDNHYSLVEYSFKALNHREESSDFVPTTGEARVQLGKFAAQIFDSLQASLKQGLNTISSLQSYVKKVAFLEWLNAHRWNFAQGSAGVAHMMTRIFLDAAKISNGPYKAKLDPNMEAFITPARAFIESFPYFFDKALTVKEKSITSHRTSQIREAITE